MQVWLTVEEAAVKTGMSVRTLQRRIASGAMPSRMENGRREVQIDLPEGPFSSDIPIANAEANPNQVPATQALENLQLGQGLQQLSHALAALADNADHKAEMAVVAYQGLARSAELAAGRYRTETRIYQAVAAVLGLALLGAVGLAVRSYTVADTLAQDVKQAESTFTTVNDDREQLRNDLLTAKEIAARAQAEADLRARLTPPPAAVPVIEPAHLTIPVATPPVQAAPTTRPASLVERVAGLLIQIPSHDLAPRESVTPTNSDLETESQDDQE